MDYLFVCNAAKNRSRTAAEAFGGRYAGIRSEERPVTEELLRWADGVFVFEEEQADWIRDRFPAFFPKVVDLGIPDVYDYGVPALGALIRGRMGALGLSPSLGRGAAPGTATAAARSPVPEGRV